MNPERPTRLTDKPRSQVWRTLVQERPILRRLLSPTGLKVVFCLAVIVLACNAFLSFQQNGPHPLAGATQVAASYEVAPRPAHIVIPANGPPPTSQPQSPGLVGQAIQIDQMTLNIDPGLYSGQGNAISSRLNTAFRDVLANFDQKVAPVLGRPRVPIPHLEVRFVRDDNCALAGSTYDEARVILVYTCNSIDPSRAINILAHEYVHQLAFENFGPRASRSDLLLVEGLASYAAGKYWLGQYSSFHNLVRNQRASGISYRLSEDYANRDVSVMNAIYYQWASFVEFLLTDTRYSQRFADLYTTGDNSIGSANYVRLYGKPLEKLESEWEAWLNAP